MMYRLIEEASHIHTTPLAPELSRFPNWPTYVQNENRVLHDIVLRLMPDVFLMFLM